MITSCRGYIFPLLESRRVMREQWRILDKQVRKIVSDLLIHTADEVESEQLEIKGWCADDRELADKVAEACACLANTSGGYVRRKKAVDTLYNLLWLKQNDPEKYAERLEFGNRCTTLWDNPRLHT